MSAGQAGSGRGARPGGTNLALHRNPLRQAVSASTWRAAWFLLAYLGFGWLLWTAVLSAGILAISLAITVAGLPLLIVAAVVIRGSAAAEQWRLQPVLTDPVLTEPVPHEPVPGEPVPGPSGVASNLGLLARARAAWTDPAIWRELAYMFGLFPFLWALDLAVLTIWLVFIGLITTPAWYWAPEETYPAGSHHGLQFGYFPHGPHGPGAVGVYVDTLPKAIGAAAVGVLLSLAFQYVVVLTARMHARVAYSLLRAPQDPLAEARSVLGRPGPLGPLRTTQQNDNSGQSAAVT